jgi:hypothetical protein
VLIVDDCFVWDFSSLLIFKPILFSFENSPHTSSPGGSTTDTAADAADTAEAAEAAHPAHTAHTAHTSDSSDSSDSS